ncbi:MAG: hypothetical protein NC548_26295 [Lachnospiraceae bacterium]|nr:hypothetical protein [Lachnospiraceae bacterium]
MPKQQKNTPEKRAAPAPVENSDESVAGKKKKRGGECQYANKVKPYLTDIARYVRCGVTEGVICEFYKVGKTQWAEYKKKYPELTETLYNAKKALQVDLVNKSYEVAMGYDYTETTTVEYKDKDGNVTGSKTTTYKRHAKADGNMIQFLLINRFPDEYARDPQAIELRKKALELAERGVIPADQTEGV